MKTKGVLTWLALGLAWALAQAAGLTIGLLGGIEISCVMFTCNYPGLISYPMYRSVIIGTTTGISIGVLEWLVLWLRIRQSGRWILASMIGWATGFLASVTLPFLVSYPNKMWTGLDWIVEGALAGTIVGIAQWFVLKEKASHTVLWILARAASWSFVSSTGATIGFLSILMGYAEVGVTGFISGIITGIPLIWLLQRQALETEKGSRTIL